MISDKFFKSRINSHKKFVKYVLYIIYIYIYIYMYVCVCVCV